MAHERGVDFNIESIFLRNFLPGLVVEVNTTQMSELRTDLIVCVPIGLPS